MGRSNDLRVLSRDAVSKHHIVSSRVARQSTRTHHSNDTARRNSLPRVTRAVLQRHRQGRRTIINSSKYADLRRVIRCVKRHCTIHADTTTDKTGREGELFKSRLAGGPRQVTSQNGRRASKHVGTISTDWPFAMTELSSDIGPPRQTE